jgi:hypothetical protein
MSHRPFSVVYAIESESGFWLILSHLAVIRFTFKTARYAEQFGPEAEQWLLLDTRYQI